MELFLRVLWGLALPLFSFSPRPFFGWRRFILRCFGAVVGKKVNIYPSARIYMPWNFYIGDYSSVGEYAFIYNLGKIYIGSSATISQRVHLCAGTHDYNDITMPLLKLGINIGDQSWICADAFIGPSVSVAEGAVVGARAVVMHDVEAWSVVAGNPAKKVKERKLKL